MIGISSTAQVVAAIGRARTVEVGMYMLKAGRLFAALEAAARRGAHVTVRVEGRPYGDTTGDILATNTASVEDLRRLGADAKLVDTDDAHGPQLHMKAAICDREVFLDDRNFADGGADTIVRDTFDADVDAVRDALEGRRAAPSVFFTTTKAASLRSETRLLRSAERARAVDVESESFGAGSGVYGALKALAAAGVHCRLLVAQHDVTPKSAAALARLEAVGVEVRSGTYDEKFAIVDERRAWIGSTNATSAHYDAQQVDWGMRTDRSDVIAVLERHFTAYWNDSKRVPPPLPSSAR